MYLGAFRQLLKVAGAADEGGVLLAVHVCEGAGLARGALLCGPALRGRGMGQRRGQSHWSRDSLAAWPAPWQVTAGAAAPGWHAQGQGGRWRAMTGGGRMRQCTHHRQRDAHDRLDGLRGRRLRLVGLLDVGRLRRGLCACRWAAGAQHVAEQLGAHGAGQRRARAGGRAGAARTMPAAGGVALLAVLSALGAAPAARPLRLLLRRVFHGSGWLGEERRHAVGVDLGTEGSTC